MLNKERLKLFRDALLSGEYKQGFGALNKDGMFCCLGVACEVAIQQGVEIKRDYVDLRMIYDNSSYVLPTKVRDWYGFLTNNPCFVLGTVFNTLTSLNDNGSTFVEIAEIIDKLMNDEFIEIVK